MCGSVSGCGGWVRGSCGSALSPWVLCDVLRSVAGWKNEWCESWPKRIMAGVFRIIVQHYRSSKQLFKIKLHYGCFTL